MSQGLSGVTFHVPPELGRYEIIGTLGRGGMATVHLARTAGEAGFRRLFAVKVMHPHLAEDEFVNMLLDEARIAARLHHPNVVPIIDLGTQGEIHYVVMEYIEGAALSVLLKRTKNRTPRLLVPVILDALSGLHAAHVLKDDNDLPLNLVHRDVSPQNVLLGADGTARLTDFGVARAESRLISTHPGQMKGKLSYMSPEQILSPLTIDRRSDVFAAGALMWSALTGRRLFMDDTDGATINNIMNLVVPPPSTVGFKPPAALDAVVLKALQRNPDDRWQSAAEMEDALRAAATEAGCLAPHREVGEWVVSLIGEELSQRRAAVRSASGANPIRLSASSEAMPSSISSSGLSASSSAARAIADVSVDVHEAAPPSRKPVMIGTIAAGVLAVLGTGAFFALRSPAAPPPAVTTTTALIAPSAQAPIKAPDVTQAPTPVAIAPATMTPPPAASTAPKPAVFAGVAPKPAIAVVAKPAASAAPTAASTPAKPTTWDKDSPLAPQ